MNERLTKRTKKGIAYMAVADKLSKADQEIEGSKPILEGLYAIFQKLADYEDTKLSPEEIKALIADNKHLRNYLVKLEHERFNSLINKYVELSEQNRELMDVIKKAIKLISEGADGNALFFLKEAIKTYRYSLCGKEIEEEGLCEDCIIDQTEIIMSQEVE